MKTIKDLKKGDIVWSYSSHSTFFREEQVLSVGRVWVKTTAEKYRVESMRSESGYRELILDRDQWEKEQQERKIFSEKKGKILEKLNYSSRYVTLEQMQKIAEILGI